MTRAGGFGDDDGDGDDGRVRARVRTTFGLKVDARMAGLGLRRPATLEEGKAAIALAAGQVAANLKPHQRRVMARIVEWCAGVEPTMTAFFVKPTGSGKTPILSQLMSALLDLALREGRPMLTIILVVPRTVLVEQVERAIREWDPRIPVAIAERTGAPGEIFQDVVTIMTYARFTAMSKAGLIEPADVDLVIQDEGHNALTARRREGIAPFKGATHLLSCTATHAFDEEKSVAALYGAGGLLLHETNRQAREEGSIAGVLNLVVRVEVVGPSSDDRRVNGLRRRWALAQAFVALLRRGVGPTDRRPEDEGADHLLRERFVYFAQDRAHGEMVREAYNQAFAAEGYRCEVIRGDEPRAVRQAKMADFAAGRLQGLVNVNILTEGFDDATIGLCAGAPSNSIVVVVQRGGRAQRLDEARPGKVGVVVDFYLVEDGRALGRPRAFHQAIGDDDVAGTPLCFTVRAADCEVGAFGLYEVVEAEAVDLAREPGGKRPELDPVPPGAWNRVVADWRVEGTHALLEAMTGRPRAKGVEDLSLVDALGHPDRPGPIAGALRAAFATFEGLARAGSAAAGFGDDAFAVRERTAPNGRVVVVVDADRRADLYAACLRHHEAGRPMAADEVAVTSREVVGRAGAAGVGPAAVAAFRAMLVARSGSERVVLEDHGVLDYRVVSTGRASAGGDASPDPSDEGACGRVGGGGRPKPVVARDDVGRVVDHLRVRQEAHRRGEAALVQRVPYAGFAALLGAGTHEPATARSWRACQARLLEQGSEALREATGVDAAMARRAGDGVREMIVSRGSVDAFDLAFAAGRHGAAERPGPDEVELHTFERTATSPATMSARARALYEGVEASSARHAPRRSGTAADPVDVLARLRTARGADGAKVRGWWVSPRERDALRAELASGGRQGAEPGDDLGTGGRT